MLKFYKKNWQIMQVSAKTYKPKCTLSTFFVIRQVKHWPQKCSPKRAWSL